MTGMDFDSLTNRGEYFAAHYLAERLTDDLAKPVFDVWAGRENDEFHIGRTPRQNVRALRGEYLHPAVRTVLAEAAQRAEESDTDADIYDAPAWVKTLTEWHDKVLDALGIPGERGTLTVHKAGRDYEVPVARHGDGIVALDCGWAPAVDAALSVKLIMGR